MRSNRRLALPAFAAATSAALLPNLLACASQQDDPPREEPPVTATPDATAIAASTGLTNFALDLHRELARDAGNGNVFVSPWSIWTSLGMLSEGARGETRKQIVAAMGLTGAVAESPTLRQGASDLRARLGAADGDVAMTTADAIWADESFDLSTDLVAALRSGFDAELAHVSFRKNPEAARDQINEWVDVQTRGRIEDLIPEGAIDANTELVLTDAIYFKGSWLHPFDEERTHTGGFTRIDGSVAEVPLMSLRTPESFPTTRMVDDAAQVAATVIELPYEGERISFVAIVPDRNDGLPKLESWLDADRLRSALSSMKPMTTAVVLPKISLEPKVGLVDTLKALGVKDAFTDAADLSGFSESGRKNLVVTDAMHAAFLEVDEKGTEAAGATGIMVGRTSMPTVVAMDRPFLFMIRERTSGAVLFLGRMMDPS